MAKSIVGLDIGTNHIRAAEIADAYSSHPRLMRFHQVAVPEDAVRRGEVIEPNTVAGLIKRLWSDGGFRTKQVVLGMGNQRVIARDLTVPKAPLAQIRESLQFTVQDMLPLPVNEAIMDFYPISDSTGEHGPVVNGLLIAAVKEAVLGNVHAVQAAGLTPIDVDLIPFALDRALVSRQHVVGTVAIIEIGAGSTSILIATNGIPQFVRIIPTGGSDITATMASRLGISTADAEAAKRVHGLAKAVASHEEQERVAVIFELVGTLLQSLRNTITYFSNTRPHDPVSSIILAGGGGRMTGFQDALAEYTRLPIIQADPLAAVALGRGVAERLASVDAGDLSVPIGLALGKVAA